MRKRLAVLSTCHNRKELTDRCLSSFIRKMDQNVYFDIYIVDDNSSDGTAELITSKFPFVKLIPGTGNLFWAGGIRLAWNTVISSNKEYDGFLLINDDVEFIDSFWEKILFTQHWSKENYNKDGIYVLSLKDKNTNKITYGGHSVVKRGFKHTTSIIIPIEQPQLCDLTNANILYVSAEVVKNIGILDSHYTHGIADFDYSLAASEKGFPVLICPAFGGFCNNDHPKNIISNKSLIERIKILYSPKGYALNEYLYYLRKHFWWKAPYAFLALWRDILWKYK